MQVPGPNHNGSKRKDEIILNYKKIIIYLLLFMVIANFYILIDIPIARPIFGYIYLTLIPGFIILLIFKNRYELSDLILLSIGLSLSFVIIVGFITDSLLFLLKISSPLSLKYIVLSLNLTMSVMLLIIILSKLNDNLIVTYNRFGVNDLCLIIIPTLFPLMAYSGTYLLKEFNNNIIIYALVTIIIIYILLVGLLHHKFSDLANIYIIFLISLSLLILIFFRTKYVYASDAIAEYILFNQVLDAGHYFEFRNAFGNLGVCLSITILPTIYCIIIDLTPSILFKVVYILPLSLTPVVCYKLARKLLLPKYSFISSIFLISQAPFLYQIAAFRTYLSIYFFSMAFLIFLNSKIDLVYRRSIFIIFFLSGVVSHYSNTVIIFSIIFLLFTFINIANYLNHRINYLNKNYTMSFSALILCFTLIFLWYAQITDNAFNNITSFISSIFKRLSHFFLLESRSVEVSAALGNTLGSSPNPIISYINFINNWLSILFIAAGVLICFLYILKIKKFENNSIKDLIPYPGGEVMIIILLSTVCAFLFGVSVITPFILTSYSLGRTYYQMIVFLSIFFTIGGICIAEYLKFPLKSRHLLVLLVLIIYFANSLAVLHELNERPFSRILNSPQVVSDPLYIYDTEEISSNWMKKFAHTNTTYYADNYGVRKISQLMLTDKVDCDKLFLNGSLIESGYIYLTYDNIVKGLIHKPVQEDALEIANVSIFKNHTKNRNLIYYNGGASILW